MEEDKKIFALLFDQAHFEENKGDRKNAFKFHLFGLDYLKDGSDLLIQANLTFVFNEFLTESTEHDITREDSVKWIYCKVKIEMISGFIDYFVTPELLDDSRSLESFKEWWATTVKNWADENGLRIEILSDKPGEFFRKAIITIPASIIPTTETDTTSTSTPTT